MTKTLPEILVQRLRAQAGLVRAATESTRQDRLQDIRALEKEVGTLCATITELPQDQAQTLEPAMTELIASLDELAEEIRAFQDRAREKDRQ